MRIKSMGKWIVMVLAVGGLAACERSQADVRWPGHRKLEEKRISDLEAYNATLTPLIQRLERRIAQLEVQIKAQQETASTH
jgi:hypothetical protein